MHISNDFILENFIQVNKSKFNRVMNFNDYHEPHNYGHIDIVREGESVLIINGRHIPVKKDQIFFIPKNTPYTHIVNKTHYEFYSFLTGYSLENDELANVPFPTVFTPKQPQNYLEQYKKAYNLYITEPPAYKMKIRNIIYNVLTDLFNEYYTSNYSTDYYAIKDSIKYLNENFSSPDLTVQILADISGISCEHFRNIFKKVFNSTPNKHINKIRINKAKSLLRDTRFSIEEISQKCGYNDYTYFSKVFSKFTNKSPTEFRK